MINEVVILMKVLRYVGVVDVAKSEGRVELRRYRKEHPLHSSQDLITSLLSQQ